MSNSRIKLKPLSHFIRNGKVLRRIVAEPLNPNEGVTTYIYSIDYGTYFAEIECYDNNHCYEVWKINKPVKEVRV